MSDPVLALILIPALFTILAAASWFQTLDTRFVREAGVPLLAGAAAGVALRFSDRLPIPHAVAAGLLLTATALYVRLTGEESEPSDGMLLGAAAGAAAGALFLGGDEPLLRIPECVLAGAVAGYGITLGVTHSRNRLRQLAIDVLTALAATATAAAPGFAVRNGIAGRQAALAAAARAADGHHGGVRPLAGGSPGAR